MLKKKIQSKNSIQPITSDNLLMTFWNDLDFFVVDNEVYMCWTHAKHVNEMTRYFALKDMFEYNRLDDNKTFFSSSLKLDQNSLVILPKDLDLIMSYLNDF